MKTKLQKAIANNNALYRTIFEQYRIKSENNDFIRYCLEETPPLYSNLVTLSENWQPDEIFRQIDENFRKESWSEWSVKDSFACLNLAKFGFDKLFDAKWIYLKSEKFNSALQNSNLRYEIIEDEKNLARWKLSWHQNADLGNIIFTPDLLKNENVLFVAGSENNKIVSGCFVNQSDDVLGISNFFAPDEKAVHLSGLINTVFDFKGKKDIVGYEKDYLKNRFGEIGFEEIGDLTVWLKARSDAEIVQHNRKKEKHENLLCREES